MTRSEMISEMACLKIFLYNSETFFLICFYYIIKTNYLFIFLKKRTHREKKYYQKFLQTKTLSSSCTRERPISQSHDPLPMDHPVYKT